MCTITQIQAMAKTESERQWIIITYELASSQLLKRIL